MRKNIILYIIAFGLVAATLFFINQSYEKLTAYTELSGGYDTEFGYFENLGREITDDAILNQEVVSNGHITIGPKLFYTDSQMIFRQVTRLRSLVRDSINIRTAGKLDTLVRQEISWLIRSNVQDSMINHKSAPRVASFLRIDSLIDAGANRTLFLSAAGKTHLQAEISKARKWVIIFVALSGILLIYTTISFFRQKSIRKGRELLFSSIIDSSDDAILSKNLKGIVTSWNHGAEKVFGYAPSEIIGKHISILIPPHLPDEEAQIMKSVISGKGMDHHETERTKKDGSIINVSLTISSIKDAAGNTVGASKIARDITDQKKAAEEIIRVYKEKETVLNRINDAVVSVDNHWRYTFLNDAAMGTHPFSKEETLGKVIWDVHPEMEGTIFWDKYHEAMETKKATEVESYYAPMDTWFNVKVYPSADGLTIFYKDFTASKKAEEKLRQTLKEVIDYKYALDESSIVAITDQKGIIKYVNNNFCKISKYSADELIGQDHRIINSGYHSKEFIRNLWTSIANGKIWKGELKNKAKDGTIYWVDTTIVPFLNAEGKPYQYIAIRADITDRKKAEEDLAYNELRFRSLIESSAEGIVLSDEFSNNIYRSPGAEKISGMLPKDNTISRAHPEDLENIRKIREEVISNPGVPIDFQGRFLHAAGHYFWMEGTFTNLLHVRWVNAIVTNYRDITQRKETEQKLISSEKRFRALIEHNYDSISLLDESFKIIYRSPSTFRITGYTNEEIEHTDSTKNVHPEDIGKVEDMFRELMANPGKPVKLLYRNRHKEGHYIWLDGIITNLLQDKDVKAIVTNFRDITERVAAEEKLTKSEKIYKTIASSIPGSVICLLDTDYRYLLIEGDMLEKLGYSRNLLLNKKAQEVLPAEFFAEAEKNFKKVFEGEIVTAETRRNGYDTISKYIPLKDDKGVVYSMMTVSIDVTELKNAQRGITELNHTLEAKIVSRTEQLKKSNEELEAFTYSVSHDLRAPLRGVMGFATILEEDYASQLDDEARRITDVIKKNALKMGNLIDDLLAFSRTGREDLIKTRIDTMTMVEHVIAEAMPGNPARNIEWITGVLPDINGDINTMRQVWINLISNAIKYSSHNENPRIEIGFFNQEDQAVFFVKDNGVGFDMQYSKKLFKVFQRLHSSEEFEGTGVGLALAGKIIFKHGGKVWAEGVEGKGATFYFSLPGNDVPSKRLSNELKFN